MRRSLLNAARSVAVLLCSLVATTGPAQTFPQKPMRMILPFAPGGGTDILGRAIGDKLAEVAGQSVVPDNRPGAGGNLGLELASEATPDGYTIALSSPLVAVSPSLYRKLAYDPLKDLSPITRVAVVKNVLLVNAAVPAKDFGEFIKLLEREPGKLNFGTGGVGTTMHLAPALMMSVTDTKMTHVPYRGAAPAIVALIAGQVQAVVTGVHVARRHVGSGKVRALAVLSDTRSPLMPDLPTAKEQGFDGIDVPLWYVMLVPAGTPGPIVDRLNALLHRTLKSKDLIDKLATFGIEPVLSTPAEAARFVQSEAERYAKVIAEAGIPKR